MPLECAFTDYGCPATQIQDAGQLKNHEKRCPYRLIRCIHPPCHLLVPVSRLIEHCNSSHKFALVKPHNAIHALHVNSQISMLGKMGKVDSRSYWNVTHIVMDGKFSLERKHFFTEMVQAAAGDGDWSFWVYMLGSEEEVREYDYKLTFNSELPPLSEELNEYIPSLEFNGSCISVDQDIESLLRSTNSSSNYLTLSHNMLRKFIVNGTLSLSLIHI